MCNSVCIDTFQFKFLKPDASFKELYSLNKTWYVLLSNIFNSV